MRDARADEQPVLGSHSRLDRLDLPAHVTKPAAVRPMLGSRPFTVRRARTDWHPDSYAELGSTVGVSLTKGGTFSLTKQAGAAGVDAVNVGLGWDAHSTDGADFDLDACAIGVKADGKVLSDKYFVFYLNLASPEGAIRQTGEHHKGACDKERITLNLAAVPAEVDKVVFAVAVWGAVQHSQTFGQVRNAFIRVLNPANGEELARYDLNEDTSTETAMVFGELYRNQTEWRFRAVGEGHSPGLVGIAKEFGISFR